MRHQLLREGILDVESVIITHTHADHIMGLDDIRAFCLKYQKPIPVYASPESQADIERIFPYAFAESRPGIWVPRLEFREIRPQLAVAGLTIHTFFVDHGSLPCLAFRVNDVAYLTDVSHIPEGVMPALRGLKTLVLDAVRFRPHPNHFHFEKALEVAEEIGAETTYLTHLSDDYHHPVTEATLPKGIKLAFDGLNIQL
jgi:phosphoribosyl 1,2-cyclic phosphate phosphodiesterase